MRRKVTINVDEDWLKLIDSTRGLIPRSRYIEMIARDIGTSFPRSENPGVPEAERSPELVDPRDLPPRPFEDEPIVPAEILTTENVKQRYDKQLASAGLPAVRKHAPTCSCAVCKPVK